MTRTHVDEGELVELQRKALAIFMRLDALADRMFNNENRYAPMDLNDIDVAAVLAREVSDQVDALTDYVRTSLKHIQDRALQIQQELACEKWIHPE